MNRGADITLEKTLPSSIESERAVLPQNHFPASFSIRIFS